MCYFCWYLPFLSPWLWFKTGQAAGKDTRKYVWKHVKILYFIKYLNIDCYINSFVMTIGLFNNVKLSALNYRAINNMGNTDDCWIKFKKKRQLNEKKKKRLYDYRIQINGCSKKPFFACKLNDLNIHLTSFYL